MIEHRKDRHLALLLGPRRRGIGAPEHVRRYRDNRAVMSPGPSRLPSTHWSQQAMSPHQPPDPLLICPQASLPQPSPDLAIPFAVKARRSRSAQYRSHRSHHVRIVYPWLAATPLDRLAGRLPLSLPVIHRGSWNPHTRHTRDHPYRRFAEIE